MATPDASPRVDSSAHACSAAMSTIVGDAIVVRPLVSRSSNEWPAREKPAISRARVGEGESVRSATDCISRSFVAQASIDGIESGSACGGGLALIFGRQAPAIFGGHFRAIFVDGCPAEI